MTLWKRLLSCSIALLATSSYAAPDTQALDATLPAPQASPGETVKASKAEPTEPPLPVFVPPSRGATGQRQGAATRSITREVQRIELIAPNHVGLTARTSPTLYWHLAAASTVPVALTLVQPNTAQPLLSLELEAPVAAGLHALPLAEHGVTLQPGIDYRWHAALVVDAQERSRDVVSTALLRYEVERVAAVHNVTSLAAAGLWYDTFAELQRQICAADAEQTEYLQRAQSALLQQIGLGELGL